MNFLRVIFKKLKDTQEIDLGYVYYGSLIVTLNKGKWNIAGTYWAGACRSLSIHR